MTPQDAMRIGVEACAKLAVACYRDAIEKRDAAMAEQNAARREGDEVRYATAVVTVRYALGAVAKAEAVRAEVEKLARLVC